MLQEIQRKCRGLLRCWTRGRDRSLPLDQSVQCLNSRVIEKITVDYLQRKSGSENVWRRGIRMTTAELALEFWCQNSARGKYLVSKTHMQATPRIATTAHFVRISICKSLTRKIGRTPTVKSQMPAKMLQSQLIAIMTLHLTQWPS